MTVNFSWALPKNSVMEMMKLDSYVTQSHNIKMFAYMCGNVWILLPPYHFKTLPSTHKATVKWLMCKYTVIYIQMYINDSPEDHTFIRGSTYAANFTAIYYCLSSCCIPMAFLKLAFENVYFTLKIFTTNKKFGVSKHFW